MKSTESLLGDISCDVTQRNNSVSSNHRELNGNLGLLVNGQLKFEETIVGSLKNKNVERIPKWKW